MRRIISFMLAAVMLCALFGACTSAPVMQPSSQADAVQASSDDAPPEEITSISVYVQPYFAQQAQGVSVMRQLTDAFHAVHPEVNVTLHELTSDENGQKTLADAIEAGSVDLLFDTAAAAASYARLGKLHDLAALYDESTVKNLPAGVVNACTEATMKYLMPIAVSPYLMAFNKEMLEAAGVLELLPYERSETRAWTADEYTALLAALQGKLPEGVDTGTIYAKSSSGDAATRSLITNLFGARFVNDDRSEYTIDSEPGKKAFAWLNKTVADGLLKLDKDKTSADTVQDFADGKAAHTLLYTTGLANKYADRKKDGFTEIFMPYPTQPDTAPSLEYSLYGFCAFDSKDAKRFAAARLLMEFAVQDRQNSRMAAVMTGGISPFLDKNELRYDSEYLYVESLKPLLGGYVPATEGYDLMKTYWFGSVADAAAKDAKTDTVLKTFSSNAAQTQKDAKAAREKKQQEAASSSK